MTNLEIARSIAAAADAQRPEGRPFDGRNGSGRVSTMAPKR